MNRVLHTINGAAVGANVGLAVAQGLADRPIPAATNGVVGVVLAVNWFVLSRAIRSHHHYRELFATGFRELELRRQQDSLRRLGSRRDHHD